MCHSPKSHARRRPYRRSEFPPAVLGRAYFAAHGRLNGTRQPVKFDTVWQCTFLRFTYPAVISQRRIQMVHFYVNMYKHCRLLASTGTLRSRDVPETVLASLSLGPGSVELWHVSPALRPTLNDWSQQGNRATGTPVRGKTSILIRHAASFLIHFRPMVNWELHFL